MPKYDTEHCELTFEPDESEANHCPVCGGEPDYDALEVLDDSVSYPWKCGGCGSEGMEFARLVFDGHQVNFSTVSWETQRKYTEPETFCINGPLRIGDLVLATIDDGCVPCLPGVVTGINLFGTPEHGTGNESDDVHVDFTGDYSEKRKQEIAEFYAKQIDSYRPFELVHHDYLIMDPACLLNITGIAEEKLRWIMESQENAIRYAYQVVRALAAPLKNEETAG